MNTLPHADAVQGDLMTAAQGLLLLDWQAPAVLTARVALESYLRPFVLATQLECQKAMRDGIGGLCHHLKRHDLIGEKLHFNTVKLGRRLSAVAHGEKVSLLEAVELLERTQEQIEAFDRLRGCN